MHNRQGITPKLLWASLMDYDMWPLYAISFTLLIPTNPPEAYLTLKLKSLGFDTFETNLLTIPAYVLFLVQLIFWTWTSEKINNRMAVVFFYSVWCFPLLLALELLPANSSAWSWYALTALLIGFPYIHSINGTSECWSVGRFNANGMSCSQPHLSKCRLCSNENHWECPLQHDLPGELGHSIKCTCPPLLELSHSCAPALKLKADQCRFTAKMTLHCTGVATLSFSPSSAGTRS